MKLPNIFEPLFGYLQARVDLKKAKAEAEAQAYMTAAQGEHAWELVMARQAETSLKDEYWTALLSVPLIMVFFPVSRPWIMDGFAALEGTPEWYLWGVGSAMAMAFARRRVPDFLGGALGKFARKG